MQCGGMERGGREREGEREREREKTRRGGGGETDNREGGRGLREVREGEGKGERRGGGGRKEATGRANSAGTRKFPRLSEIPTISGENGNITLIKISWPSACVRTSRQGESGRLGLRAGVRAVRRGAVPPVRAAAPACHPGVRGGRNTRALHEQ